MKTDLHPTLNNVVFIDLATNKEFPTKSTMTSDKTKMIGDEQYYVVSCSVTSDSHPAYTGEQRLVDTAGRIDKFKQRYGSLKARGGDKKKKAKK
ncbi:MAG: type B 50S ribosomal protein L31 [Verrucomicrobiota bacterium]